MNIHVENIRIDKSYGIGMRPISFIVELGMTHNAHNILSLEQEIQESDCRDVVFYGEINSNIEALIWLIPKLMSDLVTTTIVSDKGIPKVIANRLVLVASMSVMKRQLKELMSLHQGDAILLDVDNVGELNHCQKILYNHEVIAEWMFDEDQIDVADVIEKKIFDMTPCRLL